jgi:hypothetical protein
MVRHARTSLVFALGLAALPTGPAFANVDQLAELKRLSVD